MAERRRFTWKTGKEMYDWWMGDRLGRPRQPEMNTYGAIKKFSDDLNRACGTFTDKEEEGEGLDE